MNPELDKPTHEIQEAHVHPKSASLLLPSMDPDASTSSSLCRFLLPLSLPALALAFRHCSSTAPTSLASRPATFPTSLLKALASPGPQVPCTSPAPPLLLPCSFPGPLQRPFPLCLLLPLFPIFPPSTKAQTKCVAVSSNTNTDLTLVLSLVLTLHLRSRPWPRP